MLSLEQIDHVALTVTDLKRSIAWYQDVLGLERKHQDEIGDEPAFLYAGGTALALFEAASATPGKTPDTDTIAMRHLAFRVDRMNFELTQAELREAGVNFQFADHDISHSVYFKDPDGHLLEITTYEL